MGGAFLERMSWGDSCCGWTCWARLRSLYMWAERLELDLRLGRNDIEMAWTMDV